MPETIENQTEKQAETQTRTLKPSEKLYAKWWFWTILALAVACVILIVLLVNSPKPICSCPKCVENSDAYDEPDVPINPSIEENEKEESSTPVDLTFNFTGPITSEDFNLEAGKYKVSYSYDNYIPKYESDYSYTEIKCNNNFTMLSGKENAKSYSNEKTFELWSPDICYIHASKLGAGQDANWHIEIVKTN